VKEEGRENTSNLFTIYARIEQLIFYQSGDLLHYIEKKKNLISEHFSIYHFFFSLNEGDFPDYIGML
jgi:hypothetical protein